MKIGSNIPKNKFIILNQFNRKIAINKIIKQLAHKDSQITFNIIHLIAKHPIVIHSHGIYKFNNYINILIFNNLIIF